MAVPAPTPLALGTVYVGDLNNDVNEADLYQLFHKIGPVTSIRVVKDHITRTSKGYAYVNFDATVDSAAVRKAIESLNYVDLKGQPMRIMLPDKDSKRRTDGVGNVFIKGLESGIDSRTLHDTFEVFGEITSAKVVQRPEGRSWGYVQYLDPEAGRRAIEKANGMLLKGKAIRVERYVPRNERSTKGRFTNVYVKNIPEKVQEESQLMSIFESLGGITSAYLPKDAQGKPRGFGFVNFGNPKSAAKAVADFNGHKIDGSKLFVAKAEKKATRKQMLTYRYAALKHARREATKGKNVYVKRLPKHIDDEAFQKLFEKFGEITSAKVMKDDQGRSRGFGFVCFASIADASKALMEMNGMIMGAKPLYVALAQSKEERQAMLHRAHLMSINFNPVSSPGFQSFHSPNFPLPPPSPYPHPGYQMPMGLPQMTPPLLGLPGVQAPLLSPPMSHINRDRPLQSKRGRKNSHRRTSSNNSITSKPVAQASNGWAPPPAPVFPMATAAAEGDWETVQLGERLFPLVYELQPHDIRAQKITGMILELEKEVVRETIENKRLLDSKVDEALTVLSEVGMLGRDGVETNE